MPYHPDAEFPLAGDWKEVTIEEADQAINSGKPFVIEGVLEDYDGENFGHETAWLWREAGSKDILSIETEGIAERDLYTSYVDAKPEEHEDYTIYRVEDTGIGFFFYVPAE